jgi:hypothetical protein
MFKVKSKENNGQICLGESGFMMGMSHQVLRESGHLSHQLIQLI